MISIDTTWMTVVFAVFGITYLGAVLLFVVLNRGRNLVEGEARRHAFSIVVPARNEEGVLARSVDALMSFDYPADRYEVLVVDDGSTDATPEILRGLQGRFSGRLLAFRIEPPDDGHGKAEALNAAMAFLRTRSRFTTDEQVWVIGVFDADGVPERNMLLKASHTFLDPAVGGVQTSVRIANRGSSLLARLQDVEFTGFSRVTQLLRTHLAGNASLGGNGQFVRAEALLSVADDSGRAWNPKALTEDLDLATRLAMRNWDVIHLNTTSVWQEGVTNLRSLIRQRTRWAWGSLQVFRDYVLSLKVLREPHVKLVKRLDILFNLTMFIVSPLVLISWLATGLAAVGLISVATLFPMWFTFILSFAFFPVVAYGMYSTEEYQRASIPLDLLLFGIYTYHWIPCLYRAAVHVVAGHAPVWAKTVRATTGDGGESADVLRLHEA